MNGFLFDPEVVIFGSSSLPLQSEPYTAATPGAPLPAGMAGTGMTEMARQTSLNRGRSITQRIRRLQRSILRPFALATRAPLAQAPHYTNGGGWRNGYPYEATPVDGGFDNDNLNTNFNANGTTFANFNGQTQSHNYNQTHHRDTSLLSQPAHRAHATIRQTSEPSYLSRVMQSDAFGTSNPSRPSDALSLPFRLSISHLHSKTQRNVPYLRQSWTRIDFVAIVCFWITFGLATTGLEHGSGGIHIGVFRAISVIRITRLLSVTSGTTVSFLFLRVQALVIDMLSLLKSSKTIMHSLKTARPLLASVAYFVIFAMVLFSYVFYFLIFSDSLYLNTCFPSSINPTSM